jgi:thioredoxin 1
MAIKVNDANFKKEVLDADLPVLVDFWAEWCGPCLMVAPAVESVEKKYQGKLKVCKVNVDEAPNTSSEYGIMSIPTLYIFEKGKPMDQIVGAVPESEIISRVEIYV